MSCVLCRCSKFLRVIHTSGMCWLLAWTRVLLMTLPGAGDYVSRKFMTVLCPACKARSILLDCGKSLFCDAVRRSHLETVVVCHEHASIIMYLSKEMWKVFNEILLVDRLQHELHLICNFCVIEITFSNPFLISCPLWQFAVLSDCKYGMWVSEFLQLICKALVLLYYSGMRVLLTYSDRFGNGISI